MKFNIYSFEDPEQKAFAGLQVKLESPKDIVEQICRQLRKNPGDDIQNYVLWYLGTFDDAEGILVSKKEKLLVIKELVQKKEENEDGK